MKLVNFSRDKDRNLKIKISNIHTVVHPTAASTVSDRNSTSPDHTSKYTGRFLYAFTGGQSIHCTEF